MHRPQEAPLFGAATEVVYGLCGLYPSFEAVRCLNPVTQQRARPTKVERKMAHPPHVANLLTQGSRRLKLEPRVMVLA